MKTSDNSFQDSTKPAPPRRQLHLDGPSVPLDADQFAVRRDLAELAAADQVFAQQYAEPIDVELTCAAVLYSAPRLDCPPIGELAKGDMFSLVDMGRDWAWGRTRLGVGYIASTALKLPT